MAGQIRNMTALPRPILATKQNGNLVQIVALGDVEGHSPSCWFIDENGQIGLEGTNSFTVFDPQYLPPSKQVFASIVGSQRR